MLETMEFSWTCFSHIWLTLENYMHSKFEMSTVPAIYLGKIPLSSIIRLLKALIKVLFTLLELYHSYLDYS